MSTSASMIDIEATRLALQLKLDAERSQAERNRMGQFATPAALADEMMVYAKQLMPRRRAVNFLDPAFGTGAFYASLLRAFPEPRVASALGVEVDAHYGLAARTLWEGTKLRLTLDDFTRLRPPEDAAARANLLICNPPYVRHHHMEAEEKRRLQARVYSLLGLRPSGLSGLYCYFLWLAHAWMADDAVAGWLVPAEFMDVNYGRTVKEYLLKHVTLLRIHRFDPQETQFDDALVSSAVVWFRHTPPADGHRVEFSFGGTLLSPRLRKAAARLDLDPADKWTRFPAHAPKPSTRADALTIGDLFIIKRGIATGSNDFFVLSPAQAAALKIPRRFLCPILPSPRYLEVDEIHADADGSPAIQRPMLLFHCTVEEGILQREYPAVWEYVQHGVNIGLPRRYLCSRRTPWYAQESRAPAPFLCTYMSRPGEGNGRPFRFLLNHSQAIAANVYLMLYPKPALAQLLRAQPELLRSLWDALNRIAPESLRANGRVYGGGLYKLEPRELAAAPVKELGAPFSRGLVQRKQARLLF